MEVEVAGKTFVGFGFGAIQGGLFLYEAFKSGNFDRLVVAEVMPPVVDALRKNDGCYDVNIATADGVHTETVTGIEVLNPTDEADYAILLDALAEANEIATALPSVDFYGDGTAYTVSGALIEGTRRRLHGDTPPSVLIYTAENNVEAAELLTQRLAVGLTPGWQQYVCVCNTVIGKMSGIVVDDAQIAEQGLARVTPDSDRALLVEAFNRILISHVDLAHFERGIQVFEEKGDLAPFEEAKLYGHNATHALIGYLLDARGLGFMADAAEDAELMSLARTTFLQESGGALCRKYAGVDPLFTTEGFAAHVDDLLERMMNPHLRDTVERVTRDPRRKLAWNDRLIGAMRLALAHDVTPTGYAQGARAAIERLMREANEAQAAVLDSLWASDVDPIARKAVVHALENVPSA
ncbi:MAG: mannitol-1-phosphate 5-dehydrogenase [Candidatus Promineifilaceae bacterium]